jgi:DNA-3-methyladenine glycosylase I
VEPPRSGVVRPPGGAARCWWCAGDPLYESYHDREWGRPVADDRRLFEKICLEGFQSGLSWLTILRKRESFRRAFRSFDFEAVARFNARSVERLMGDAGIVRNRAKIEATIGNARRCIDLVEERGSLAAYVWSFEPPASGRPRSLDWPSLAALGPSPEAVAMSKDLKRRGWSFVGPTTVYSFMEAMGLVNDHVSKCGVWAEVEAERSRFRRPGA